MVNAWDGIKLADKLANGLVVGFNCVECTELDNVVDIVLVVG